MSDEPYHLGNGVFASYDGERIELRAVSPGRAAGDVVLFLDDMMVLKFMEFIGQVMHAPKPDA